VAHTAKSQVRTVYVPAGGGGSEYAEVAIVGRVTVTTSEMLGEKATYLPRHPSVELNTKTMRTILKELGLTKE